MSPSIWGVFHDGEILGIAGAVPGELLLTIEIGYLRGMFEGDGTGFEIRLKGCTKLRYSEYDEEPTEDLARIRDREPEILYVTSETPLVLDCVMGSLELEYQEMSVTLDTGSQVSEEDLAKASEHYWQSWREGNKSDA